MIKLNSAGAVSASLLPLNRPGGDSFVLSAGKMSLSVPVPVPVPDPVGGEDAVRNLQSIFFALAGSFMTGRQRFKSTERKGEGRRGRLVLGGMMVRAVKKGYELRERY